MIRDDRLREYADLLEANGFAIYEPGSQWDYFTYSQMVDGVECFGTVQSNGYRSEQFREYSHSMPIKPSREHGSGMFVDGVPDALTVEAAQKVAQPTNRNHLVGTHRNYRDERFPLPARRNA